MNYGDYSPYGTLLDGRHGQQNGTDYRYGFQGQEADDEIKGEGNSYNYTFRMHDPRIGRFFARDPLAPKYPWYTPYQFAGNKVIAFIELEGLEEAPATIGQGGCVSAGPWTMTDSRTGKVLKEGFSATYENGTTKKWTKDRTEGVWDLQGEIGGIEYRHSTPSSTPTQTAEGTFLQNVNAIGFNGSFRDYNAGFSKAMSSYLEQKGYGGLALATSISGGVASAFISKIEILNPVMWKRAYDGLGANIDRASSRSDQSGIGFFTAYGANAIDDQLEFNRTADVHDWSEFWSSKTIDLAGGIYGGASSFSSGTTTVYRNFGWNEYQNFRVSGNRFQIGTNFGSKQFWLDTEGLNWWTSKPGFSKNFTAKITVKNSAMKGGYRFPDAGRYNAISFESQSALDVFNNGMKIE